MVIQAPSQTVEEARSHSKPHLTTAVGSVSAAAADDPSTPNTKYPAAVRLDDEDSHSECNGGGTSAREMPPRRRRGSAPKAPTGTRKRNYNTRVSLLWTASTPPSSSISALFVSGKGLCIAQKQLAGPTTIANCIPLWPAYELDIKGPIRLPPDMSGARWLHFTNREEWVRAIVGIDGSRDTKSIEEPRQLLKAAIIASRRAGGIVPDGGSDEESNEDQPMKGWRGTSFKKCVTLKIKVLEHTLLALNTLRPIALRCDDDTISFLNAIVVPSIIKARSQSVTVPDTETPAPFNFSGKDKLNFPGKVLWKPTTFSYELKLSGTGATQLDKGSTTTDLEGKPLQVPPGLRGSEFQDARKRICHLACLAWNQRDRSTRPRFFPGDAEEAEGTAE